ncbi:hypothetical protein SCUCBS95973_002836 [Sporothrix curviconia]|uniref:Uncharacterized protein n=1 Tax=Sporothrix curviconia TaxID=1260050 RepID=A0ABP0BAD2_9PEZI
MHPLIAVGTALITGAGSGIGRSIALKFAERGCQKLFLVDINKAGLTETQRLVTDMAPSAKTAVHITNVTVAAEVEAMVAACVEAFGRIDFAMNNAGIAQGGVRTTETSTAMFDRTIDVNERGVFLCEKYEIRQMLQQEPLPIFTGAKAERNVRGSIVNTCSLAGFSVLANLSAYTSSKHAVYVLTRVDARQFAPQQIRVHSVCPGFVPTPLMAAAGMPDQFYEDTKTESAQNRMTDPEEIAQGVLFLSTSFAAAITGVNLSIDSGAGLYHVY